MWVERGMGLRGGGGSGVERGMGRVRDEMAVWVERGMGGERDQLIWREEYLYRDKS